MNSIKTEVNDFKTRVEQMLDLFDTKLKKID